MAQTLYASFENATQCEQAAGALLDYGVRKEDISLVANESHRNNSNNVIEAANQRAVNEVGYRGGETRGAVLDRPGFTTTGTGDIVDYDTTRTIDGDVVAGRTEYLGTPGLNTGANDVDYVNEQNRITANHGDVKDAPDVEGAAKQGISVTTPADAGAGAAKGAGIGLGVGILAGIASLIVPGFGLVVGGGALATAIAGAVGATAAGAAAGGVTGYLKDQGVPEHVATDYHKTVEQGGALLAVNVPSGKVDATEAQAILTKYGASNVNVY